MADPRDALEKQFRNQFSDYDQTVDVVCCWQAACDYLLTNHLFYRFGKFRDGSGRELTPDFAVASTTDGRNASPGSLICDVKKLPNPFPDGADEQALQRAQDIFGTNIEEVFRYGEAMQYVSDYEQLPKLTFSEHDVVLLTPIEVSSNVYNYLKKKLQTRPFNVGRPLVLVDYTYNQADHLERYVFSWKQGEANSEFSNLVLREQMITRAQPMKGWPKYFMPYKIKQIVCNDLAPSIYLIVFLWVEVFLKLMSEEQFESWQLASTASVVELEVTPQSILTLIKEQYSASLTVNDIRRALKDLEKIKRAVLKDATKEAYLISYSNLAGRVLRQLPGDQDGIPERNEFREYGRVFATLLAEKELRLGEPRRLRTTRARNLVDYPMLPFGN